MGPFPLPVQTVRSLIKPIETSLRQPGQQGQKYADQSPDAGAADHMIGECVVWLGFATHDARRVGRDFVWYGRA